jgi:hypothetical protein
MTRGGVLAVQEVAAGQPDDLVSLVKARRVGAH